MTKDTHIAGGLAITMALAMPQGFKELAVCLTAATIGSVISDIDITTSESRRDLNKILIISVVAIVVCTILEVVFKLGIVSLLQSETDMMRILCGIGFFFLPAIIFGAALVLIKIIKQCMENGNYNAVNLIFWLHIVFIIISAVFLVSMFV